MMLSDSIISNLDEAAILLFDRGERLVFMNKAAEELLRAKFPQGDQGQALQRALRGLP
ncbi:MAG: PAS domain-containing protein [Desulfomicrobium escambiense]|nr:PAS domain-containing protein [Desulfomicrobium escambiense]